MHSKDASPLRIGQIDAVVQPGDLGEQLVAHLLTSIFVSQGNELATAKAHVARAQELAATLESKTLTYRPEHPSKFARMEFELEGRTEARLFSIINDSLVMPHVEISKIVPVAHPAASLTNLDVVVFMLRLRTRRISEALNSLARIQSSAEFLAATGSILAKCLYHEVLDIRPLERAEHCFMLAHDLIGKRNLSLAALALTKAESALDLHIETTLLKEHSAGVQEMKKQIAAISKELKAGAS